MKDRSQKPLANLGSQEPWRAYMGGAAVKTAPEPCKQTVTERMAQKFPPRPHGQPVTPPTSSYKPSKAELEMLAWAQQHPAHFDAWGQKFVASVVDQYNKNGGLTQKQWWTLKHLLEKV